MWNTKKKLQFGWFSFILNLYRFGFRRFRVWKKKLKEMCLMKAMLLYSLLFSVMRSDFNGIIWFRLQFQIQWKKTNISTFHSRSLAFRFSTRFHFEFFSIWFSFRYSNVTVRVSDSRDKYVFDVVSITCIKKNYKDLFRSVYKIRSCHVCVCKHLIFEKYWF